MAAKAWIRDYLKRLAGHIERNEITNERALSATVEIPLQGWAKARTLMQALEYDKQFVHPQYPIQIGTSKPRVDFLLGRDSDKWMLDLKKPGEMCDRSKHVQQLQSYLGQEKVALGVLFSGTWAMAYVNPDHSFVAELCGKVSEDELLQFPQLDLRTYPVYRAKMTFEDTREMVRFFQMLRFEGKLPNIETLVQRLASDHLARVRREGKANARSVQIASIVRNMLAEPSDLFIESLITSSTDLSQLRVTPKEVQKIWGTIKKS